MGIIAPISSAAVLAAIPAGGITNEKMAENSINTAQILANAVHTEEIIARAVTSAKLAEVIEIVKGFGVFAHAAPGAQPAAIASPAAELAPLKTAVDLIREALKAYGFTA